MSKNGERDQVEDAAKALSDLHMFHAIMVLCESSLFSSDSFSAEDRIVKICKSESSKCLSRYHRARAKAGAKP